ncbi:MAG: AmmeMemoRadiSam system protein B, partial [Candidatus Omnitrophota bacterium]
MIAKITIAAAICLAQTVCFAAQPCVKEPNVAGAFYPGDAAELSAMIDGFLNKAGSASGAGTAGTAGGPAPANETSPSFIDGTIFGLISPHAGYQFSGQTAAYGYNLLKNREYKTVVVMGPNHSVNFNGVSIYSQGYFKTPLGDIEIDRQFAGKLLNADKNIVFEPSVFEREHSIEVQLPFLQKTIG